MSSIVMIVESPIRTMLKMEMNKKIEFNPIMSDVNSDGSVRYHRYDVPFFNYGFLPQTWDDPFQSDAFGYYGDNDPLDVIEMVI
jgi:inorganic pyrophosphatase